MLNMTLYQTIALSDHWFFRFLRDCRRAVHSLSIPSPRLISVPLLGLFVAVRSAYYFVVRIFFCEPFLKANCTKYGKNFHTSVFFHWIQGRGNFVVGDNVTLNGKCSITFAARYSASPTLTIGDNTGIGHNTAITVGKSVSIGRHCRIGNGVQIFDAPGHPLEPQLRLRGQPAEFEQVRPIVIEDNVWIGHSAVIMPGVCIGRDSVVATASVVMAPVPPGVLVAGNPARQIKTL